jgi:regulator of RNase E activity RraA
MMSSATTGWPAGFVVNERPGVPDPDVIEGFRGVPAANVSDAIGRVSGTVGLTPYGGGAVVCGPAVTVRCRPGDNLMIHKALDLVVPGDVVVIDAGGSIAQAVIGGNMRLIMLQRGAVAAVVDGAIRDSAEFAEGGFPTLARAVNHRGPSKDGPGEINVPIACAGMTVSPGDLVIVDLDGAVTIPRADAREVLAAVEQVNRKEAASRKALEENTAPLGRWDYILREKGCPVGQ